MKCTLVALELAGEVVEAAAKQCLWSVKHESSERISSKSDVPRECSGEEKMEGSREVAFFLTDISNRFDVHNKHYLTSRTNLKITG